MGRTVIWMCLLLCASSVASATVCVRVCRTDEITPLEPVEPNMVFDCNDRGTAFAYRDIMVGTRLVMIVDSNAGGEWSGGLLMGDPDRAYGELYGRDFNDRWNDWEGWGYPEAGENAHVNHLADINYTGFMFYGDENTAVAGDWYIIDYEALVVGECNVGFYFYDTFATEDPLTLLHELQFTHVPTRDFSGDTIVDFRDFCHFMEYWLRVDCTDPEWCEGADIDRNGVVDRRDVGKFAEYWLEETQ